MTPAEILNQPARALTQAQREFYHREGYLLVENAVSPDWLARLRAVTEEMVEKSRGLTRSDAVFDLEPGHTAENPRLRRLTSPVAHHPVYWEFLTEGPLPDIAADLVGPDVKFHHSKLNFKWAAGGEEVKWHQDIQFYPHTNYSPLAIGVYLHDCGPEQGPLCVIPGSHEGPLYDQYNGRGEWVGALCDADSARLPIERAVELPGPAGSITIHNSRTVHSSRPNLSGVGRPLLLYALSSADAFAYTPHPVPTRYVGHLLRGSPARWAHVDPRPCQIPPDWSGGYTSIFAAQQKEEWDSDQLAESARRRGRMAAAATAAM